MYNVKPDPGLSGNDAHNQYLLNPNEFACGYNQASNNKKYWDPNNPSKWDWGAGCFTLIASKCLNNY